MKPTDQSYNFICFSELAYEFNDSERKAVEAKIKRRLRYYKLGKYNREMVDYIRDIKNDLFNEISKVTRSKYYQKGDSGFADLLDFNVEKMVNDYLEEFPKMDKSEMQEMIHYAIYLYYMR